jgi:hypothetical protein
MSIPSEINEFITKNYPTYSEKLSKFKKISSDTNNDEGKILSQLTVFLIDVAKNIALTYTGKVDDETELLYNISLSLIHDERVSKALGVAGSIWDNLPNVPEFMELPAFQATLLTEQAIRNIDKALNSRTCCC